MLFLVIMAVCLIYYVIIVSYAGLAASFAWFWLAAGILSGMIHLVMKLTGKGIFFREPPLWFRVGFCTTIGLGAVLALFIEALVIIGMFSQTDPDKLDYIIVLGAHVEGQEPSKSLCYRLDKAIEYMEKDEDIIVIVSGGQGPGEDVTEAYAMTKYLIDQGIPSQRIWLESMATSTRENLIFSYEMIEDKEAAVGIVTNSFHVFRASALAKRLGLDNAVGIAAPSDKLLLPSYMVREFFAIIKEKIMGYI